VRYFETRFLEEADEFVAKLDKKSARKVFYNIDLAEQTNDPKLFKKLKGEIWEFRSLYLGNQNRLLAFWDKTEPTETLVLATHGFVKKDDKVPKSEIEKAERIRAEYFNNKNKNLKK
jgi:phage-related protein